MLEMIEDILDRKWLSNGGTYVQKFEEKLAQLTQTKHCILTCNGTIALQIMIQALELTGEVIVPSFTFVATPHALKWQGITPIFCDVDPLTHNIDHRKIEALITPRTTAILAVHLWGNPCQVETLSRIAKTHNIKLIFDASHALGCSRNNVMIGNFGEAEVFSLHATKTLNTSEGGAITTNDSELAKKIRAIKNFGFSSDREDAKYIGTNGKMGEIAAATGLANIDQFERFIAINKRNHQAYAHELDGIPGIKLKDICEHSSSNYQYVVVEVDQSKAGLSRDLLMDVLHAENIFAKRYFYPGCHHMTIYRSERGVNLPVTDQLVNDVLVLPTGTAVRTDDIAEICNIIRSAVHYSSEIRHALA